MDEASRSFFDLPFLYPVRLDLQPQGCGGFLWASFWATDHQASCFRGYYPLVNYHSNGIVPIFNRKYIFNPGPFSIAILDYRSVNFLRRFFFKKVRLPASHPPKKVGKAYHHSVRKTYGRITWRAKNPLKIARMPWSPKKFPKNL